MLSGSRSAPESGGIYLYPVRYERRGAPAGKRSHLKGPGAAGQPVEWKKRYFSDDAVKP